MSCLRTPRALAMLAAVALLTLGAPASALAEQYEGRTDWSVTFTAGKEMVHAPEDMSFTDVVSDMQPGDVETINVAVRNDYAGATDWYLSNKVLKSLENSVTVAEGGAYAYELSYKGPSGEVKTLFSSDEVGGEAVGEAGEGLREATSSLESYLLLDRLGAGEQGAVTLRVALDGETNNNAYQDTLADIQMNFAVELADEDAPPAPGSSTPSRAGLPQTGDPLNMAWALALAGAAGLALLVLAICGLRMRRQQEAAGQAARGGHARACDRQARDQRACDQRRKPGRRKGGSHEA